MEIFYWCFLSEFGLMYSENLIKVFDCNYVLNSGEPAMMWRCHKQMLTESSGEVTLYSLSKLSCWLLFPSIIYSDTFHKMNFVFLIPFLMKLSLCLSNLTNVLPTRSCSEILNVLKQFTAFSFQLTCPVHQAASLPFAICQSSSGSAMTQNRDTFSSGVTLSASDEPWNTRSDSFGALYSLRSVGTWLVFDRESINKVFYLAGRLLHMEPDGLCVLEWAGFGGYELGGGTCAC